MKKNEVMLEITRSKILKNNKADPYQNILNWFKTLSMSERKQYIIELIIDVYFMEYDESDPIID